MSPADDDMDEMFGLPKTGGIADALLEGRVEPDDAPPGLQEVATFVLAARSSNADGDLAGETSVVAAFIESVRAPVGIFQDTEGGARVFSRSFSAKVAGAAAVLALGGATVAAATGSLPGSIQGVASRNLSHLGINVPDPETDAGRSGGAGSNIHGSTVNATAPSTTANEFGLCTAYFAPDSRSSTNTNRGKALSSTAFSRLSAEAQAKGETVQVFCAAVPNPGTTSNSGSDNSSTTDTGKPVTTPAGKTPGGPPNSTPAGNTPGQPPTSTPPSGTPAGPPTSTPAGHTPAGPPSSVPPSHPGHS